MDIQNFDVVKLNVGGKRFATYYDSLKRSLYFEHLLKTRTGTLAYLEDDDDGSQEIFIDRDSGFFEDVLYYQQNFKIHQTSSKTYLKALLVEARFYQFTELSIKVEKELEKLEEIERKPTRYIVDDGSNHELSKTNKNIALPYQGLEYVGTFTYTSDTYSSGGGSTIRTKRVYKEKE